MSRIRPDTTADTDFFWRSGHDGVLRILGCVRCAYLIHPPAPFCPQCGGRDVTAKVVSGLATVYSYTVLPGETASVVAIVELVEQPDLRLMTNIVSCDPDSVHIGQTVAVTFEPCEDLMIPLFVPREDA